MSELIDHVGIAQDMLLLLCIEPSGMAGGGRISDLQVCVHHRKSIDLHSRIHA
jgi:hypothetical protein